MKSSSADIAAAIQLAALLFIVIVVIACASWLAS
jgi:hypothetical protein